MDFENVACDITKKQMLFQLRSGLDDTDLCGAVDSRMTRKEDNRRLTSLVGRHPGTMANAIVVMMHMHACVCNIDQSIVFKWQRFPCSLGRRPPEYNN